MKKLIVFLGVAALLLGTGGVVYAGTYGTDITIYDNARDQANLNTWWNRGTAPGEDQETEFNTATGQGTLTGQAWDLEAYQQKNNILSIIGGFDFATGNVPGYSPPNLPLGALFLKTGAAPPFGDANIPANGTGTAPLANSIWGYDYAITFNFNTLQYLIWTPGTNAMDLSHNANGGTVGDVGNPWNIGDGWLTDGVLHAFTYTTGLADFDGYQSDSGVTTHNLISGIDLSFLVNPIIGGNPQTYLHLTYECGNDNLMGFVPENSVPIPPSALLLGTGLLGLVGLRRYRKN
ncbi:MAG: hypothetical protein WC443_05610 [Desulfobaccales bacterium]